MACQSDIHELPWEGGGVTVTGVSLEGTTARTIGVCLERFSHKKRFERQLLG